MSTKTAPKTLVEAVQLVFDALQPFDDAARQRILASAVSLLGGSVPIASSPTSSHGYVRVPTVQGPSPSSERPLSPIELIQQKAPATNPQRLAVFAYYREKVEGLSRFAKENLRPYFAKAKQPPPQNFDRDYGQAVKLGWIYDDASDSYLTSKGIEAVEAGFAGKGAPREPSATTARGKRGRQRSRRPK